MPSTDDLKEECRLAATKKLLTATQWLQISRISIRLECVFMVFTLRWVKERMDDEESIRVDLRKKFFVLCVFG
jgi:hypothetical protein